MVSVGSAQGPVLGTVGVFSTAGVAQLSIAPETVVMGRDVAKLVPSIAQCVVAFAAQIFLTGVLVITNVVSWAVIVFFTATEMLISIITTDRVKLWAVVIVNAARLALHAIAPEAVVVGRDVAHSIKTFTVPIVFIATIWDALLVIAIPVKVVSITDEARLAVLISSAAAKVLPSAMSTDGVGLNAVLIRCAAWLAVPGLGSVTVEAVVVFGNVTEIVIAVTQGVVAIAPDDLLTPSTVVTNVAVRAVAVLDTLG